MNTTTAVLLNALLDLAVLGTLVAVVLAGLRLRHDASAETLHLSQPLPFSLYAHEHGRRDEIAQPSPARAA